MPIFIEGRTVCQICGHAVNSSAGVFCVPPIFTGSEKEITFFSDGCFHMNCFNGHPLSSEVKEAIDLWNMRTATRKSAITGRVIENPEDFLSIPYLGTAEEEKKYSFLQLSKLELASWDQFSEAFDVIEGVSNRHGNEFVQEVLEAFRAASARH